MNIEWFSLLPLLKGIEDPTSLEACCIAIEESVPIESLPDLFHNVIFNYSFSTDGSSGESSSEYYSSNVCIDKNADRTRKYAAILLKRISSKFSSTLLPLLEGSLSDGGSFVGFLTDFNIEKLFLSKSKLLSGNENKILKDQAEAKLIYKNRGKKNKNSKNNLNEENLTENYNSTENYKKSDEELRSNVYKKEWFFKQKKRISSIINSSSVFPNDIDSYILDQMIDDNALEINNSTNTSEKKITFRTNVENWTSETWLARLIRVFLVGLLDASWEIRDGSAHSLNAIIEGFLSNSDSNIGEISSSFTNKKIEILSKIPVFLLDDILCIGFGVLVLDNFIDFGLLLNSVDIVEEKKKEKKIKQKSKNFQNLNIRDEENDSNQYQDNISIEKELDLISFPVKDAVINLILNSFSIYKIGNSMIEEKFWNVVVTLLIKKIENVEIDETDRKNNWMISYGGLSLLSGYLKLSHNNLKEIKSIDFIFNLILNIISSNQFNFLHHLLVEFFHSIFYSLVSNNLPFNIEILKFINNFSSIIVSQKEIPYQVSSSIHSYLIFHNKIYNLFLKKFPKDCNVNILYENYLYRLVSIINFPYKDSIIVTIDIGSGFNLQGSSNLPLPPSISFLIDLYSEILNNLKIIQNESYIFENFSYIISYLISFLLKLKSINPYQIDKDYFIHILKQDSQLIKCIQLFKPLLENMNDNDFELVLVNVFILIFFNNDSFKESLGNNKSSEDRTKFYQNSTDNLFNFDNFENLKYSLFTNLERNYTFTELTSSLILTSFYNLSIPYLNLSALYILIFNFLRERNSLFQKYSLFFLQYIEKISDNFNKYLDSNLSPNSSLSEVKISKFRILFVNSSQPKNSSNLITMKSEKVKSSEKLLKIKKFVELFYVLLFINYFYSIQESNEADHSKIQHIFNCINNTFSEKINSYNSEENFEISKILNFFSFFFSLSSLNNIEDKNLSSFNTCLTPILSTNITYKSFPNYFSLNSFISLLLISYYPLFSNETFYNYFSLIDNSISNTPICNNILACNSVYFLKNSSSDSFLNFLVKIFSPLKFDSNSIESLLSLISLFFTLIESKINTLSFDKNSIYNIIKLLFNNLSSHFTLYNDSLIFKFIKIFSLIFKIIYKYKNNEINILFFKLIAYYSTSILFPNVVRADNICSIESLRTIASSILYELIHFDLSNSIKLSEAIALFSFEWWSSLSVRGIGDYNAEVRRNFVIILRNLIPLAPLGVKLFETRLITYPITNIFNSAIDNDINNSLNYFSNPLLQNLLTKSQINSLPDSNYPLDRAIVSTINSILPTQLRSYQWEGISWWTLLRRCGLHGILADDMGLGKTLMSLLCIVIARIEMDLLKMTKGKINGIGLTEININTILEKNFLSNSEKYPHVLIITPSSLCPHWETECKKWFVDNSKSPILNPLWVTSSHIKMGIKKRLKRKLCIIKSTNSKKTDVSMNKEELDDFEESQQEINEENFYYDLSNDQNYDVFIISYNLARNYPIFLNSRNWHIVIADEAHILRNPNSKTSQAVFSLTSRSYARLALSGTPIMNKVEDLWSLFQFILPDYLNDYKNFKLNYVNKIKKSLKSLKLINNLKQNSNSYNIQNLMKLSSEGVNLLRNLHKQVLPFILRRLKSHVLNELPSRTIIEIPCPFTELQSTMYNNIINQLKTNELDFSNIDKSELENNNFSENEDENNAIQFYQSILNNSKTMLFSSNSKFGEIKLNHFKQKINPLKLISCIQLLSIHPGLIINKNDHPEYYNKLIQDNLLLNSGKFLQLFKLLIEIGILVEEHFIGFIKLKTKNLLTEKECSNLDDFLNWIDQELLNIDYKESEENPIENIIENESSEDELIFDDKSVNNIESNKEDFNGNMSQNYNFLRTNELSKSKKCLIFSQHISSLNCVGKILTDYFPKIKWAQLDGTMDPKHRFEIATKFNKEICSNFEKENINSISNIDLYNSLPSNLKNIPSIEMDDNIQILLLTTRSCGLGLNLTGADTVVFLEHDWNPFMDIQAMDRAHRIGQTLPVTVYRLISQSSIESRLMSTQKFKQKISEEVIEGKGILKSESIKSFGTELWESLSITENN